MHRYGHFSSSGMSFFVTNPNTPRAFDNFLWNDAIFSCVQQTGVGYCDYQVGNGEAVKLLTGIGRICDFDVHGRDGLMSRLLYIRDNDSGEFWTANWEPVRKPYESYSCEHGAGYTEIISQTAGIETRFRVFVPTGNDPVELWTIAVTNYSDRPRNLSLFVYNQLSFKYKWGFDSYGDMIYRCADYDQDLNAVVATKHPYTAPHNWLTGFITADRMADSYDASREFFLGQYGHVAAPDAVINGQCTNTAGSSDSTVAVLQFNLALDPGESTSLELILGATDSKDGVEALRSSARRRTGG